MLEHTWTFKTHPVQDDVHKRPHMIQSCELSSIGKSTETKSKLEGYLERLGKNGEWLANGYKVSVLGWWKISKPIVMMDP
jgi:hypothetical protein